MVWNRSSTPKKKESDSAKPFPKGSPKQKKNKTLVAAGPGSKKGRNLHIKMYLKSKSKKIVLRFNTPVSSLFYTVIPQKRGHLGRTGRSSSKCSHCRPFLPDFFLSVLKKHYSIFMSESWLVLVCFFGTINKRSDFFLLFWLRPIYQSGYSFLQFSSTQADLAKWTYQCMHSDRILLPKWNVGICYAPQVEKWPRNQDLKGDI